MEWKPEGLHAKVCGKCWDKFLKFNHRKKRRLARKSAENPFYCVVCKKKKINLQKIQKDVIKKPEE